ncbi:DeoR/GlpR transcriptional regulator [Phycicoccus sp. BSK3Z-2]|uniref:DeoR/GlpR transcriptional regulator n=1 Tax=Phycicoccus avicenniae TaxID=2828860 RepID=A0A941DBU6_9MICO|nr:DeoR/GlpR family DNA-binding transcription regulator [Phycicoccus avicenniae]MBR7744570.1 DeoR/GlpR transcriptional regulator [Phycicoccus avicenniae]
MLAAQRQALIVAALDRDGVVRVSDLAEELGVSDMTVRRDLTTLQDEGMLVKVHGGARVMNQLSTAEPSFAVKSRRSLPQKEAIAAAAADLVRPGDAIAISAGTTTLALARHLTQVPYLTVVTNSVWVANVLADDGHESTTVLLTGGQRTPSHALVGPLAVAALRSFHLDRCFLGVHGIHPEKGFTTPNLLEAETNRTMIAAAGGLVVVTDSSKWDVVGLSSMATLEQAETVVTDSGLPGEAREVLEGAVGRLHVVETGTHTVDDSAGAGG